MVIHFVGSGEEKRKRGEDSELVYFDRLEFLQSTSAGDWNLGLELESQALYCWATLPVQYGPLRYSTLLPSVLLSENLCRQAIINKPRNAYGILNSLVHNNPARDFFACQYPTLVMCPEGKILSLFT